MNIPGKRIKLTKWIHGKLAVVRVNVDAIIPDADPSEPCLEPETVRLLDDLQRRADAGDVEGLSKLGEVFVPRVAKAS